MGSDAEPAKQLLPFLQRADELQKPEPLVAYYCRLYAMERGMQIPQKERTKTTNSLLVSLMKQLEKDKKSLKLSPDDNLYLEGFASNVFSRADKQDRSGRADLNTAKTFYASSIFYEILNQFGELQPELEQKQKYAVWKAADIRKAIKEGRQPQPGPPGGDDAALAGKQTYSSDEQYSGSFVGGSDMPPQPLEKARTPTQDLGRSESIKPSPSDDLHMQQQSGMSVDYAASQSPYSPPSPAYHAASYNWNNAEQPPLNDSLQPQAPPPHQQSYTSPQLYTRQDSLSADSINPMAYPHFQSYPSFQESNLPSVPTHQPSYFQESDATVYPYPPASAPNCSPAASYHPSANSVLQTAAIQSAAERYKYNSSYQPSAENIGEAHKAARFAVGALAFDDVSVAVDHLQKALDLLTNPSAKSH